jgi:hypothetical protein
MRKLYVAPVVHPFGSRKEKSYLLQKASQMSYHMFSETVDEISERLRNEKIDRIFIENYLRKKPVRKIKSEPIKRLCNNLGVREVEKTENVSSLLTQLMSSHFFNIPFKNMFNIFMKKRDYEMARHVSKGLKDEETGLILFGTVHRPECYVGIFADEIKMRYVTSREEMFEKVLEIMKASSEGFDKLNEDYFKEMMFKQSA